MAAGTKIVFGFYNTTGNSMNLSYNYGDDEATTAHVKTAMNTIIANKEIFRNQPAAIKDAKAVITTEAEFDLS